ncbi:MAG: tRNA 2-thiouridine(34) synthase MnmA [Patescibacteria group bacterium]|nr:tRNA 2-thiouridine(34) synthase MnmA [Patescibacteria group bacterium]
MSINKHKKVVIGMSGGVDSSVAAALLKEQDYEVVGVFMHFWHDTIDKNKTIDMRIENRCCSREAEESARKVAQKLGIKFYAINVSKEFKKAVVDYFLDEYNSGRTPNPCIECNRHIKFGIMIDKALALGADYVATGHYVRLQNVIARESQQLKQFRHCAQRIKLRDCFVAFSLTAFAQAPRNDNVNFRLLKAKDENKDQSYFLYTLNQKKLARCLFPVGDYEKQEIRKLAKKFNLKIVDKKESQEICFIQSKYYGDFLRKYLKLVPGKIVNKNGDILGEHKGLPLYTIGQRRDIGIGGTGPYYVIGINRRKNNLIVSNEKDDKSIYSKNLTVKKINWISGKIPKLPFKMKAKVRYRMDSEFAVIDKIKEKYEVKFSKPQRAIMPGQSIVFYKGNETLGGGIIDKVNC